LTSLQSHQGTTPGTGAYSFVERLGRIQEPAVPDAGVGDDDTRPPRVLLDLAAKLADEHPQHIDVTFIPGPPHPVEKPAVRQELPRMLRKGLQQRPLGLCQVDLRVTAGNGSVADENPKSSATGDSTVS
jgi:hypothetical protein